MKRENDIKIAFCLSNTTIPDYFYEFMKLLGVDKNRIIIIKEVMGFSKIIVPDQVLKLHIGFHNEILGIYDKILKTSLQMTNQKRQNIFIKLSIQPMPALMRDILKSFIVGEVMK